MIHTPNYFQLHDDCDTSKRCIDVCIKMVMKANFDFVFGGVLQEEMDKHASFIAGYPGYSLPGSFRNVRLPTGFENYHCVDVLGKEFTWMNETFPKDQFKWYHWFESVFLVPEEMVPFLILRWS